MKRPHTYIFSKFSSESHHFKNDNNFYDENQKYTVKLNDFCVLTVGESVKFSRDFNVKKKMTTIFSQKFHVFDIKAAIFIFLGKIFQF